MFGARYGAKGALYTAVYGSSGDDEAPPSQSWTVDGTSGKGVPATAGEWNSVLAAAGVATGGPSALWLLQEASGNPADSVGSFPLTASAGWTYRAAVTGWSRKGLSCLDGGTATLITTDAALPDISTNSQLIFGYISMPAAAPGVVRVLCASGTTMLAHRINTTPRNICVGTGSTTGTVDPTNAVRPAVLKLDRSSNTGVLYTDQEKLSVANVTTMTGKRAGYGGLGANTPAMIVAYGALFVNGAAEIPDAGVKSILQVLGWTIPWS